MSKIKINSGSGPQVTVNKPGEGSSVTINKQDPVPFSVTSVSIQQINIVWPQHDDAIRYRLKRSTDAGHTDEKQIWSGNRTSYGDTGLTRNTQYWYRVYWVDVDGAETLLDAGDDTTKNAAVTYTNEEAESVIEAINVDRGLTSAEKTIIDDFFTEIKASTGLLGAMKAIYWRMFGNEHANRLNFITPIRGQLGRRAISNGAITHNARKVSYAGVAGASEAVATMAFECTWLVPANSSSQDSKCYGWDVTDSGAANQYMFGATQVSPNVRDFINLKGAAAQNDEFGLSGVNITGQNIYTGTIVGTFMYERFGSTSTDFLLRVNGVDQTITGNTSTGQNTIPINSVGYNSNAPNPNPLGGVTIGQTYWFCCEALTSQQKTDLQTAIDNFKTGMNAL